MERLLSTNSIESPSVSEDGAISTALFERNLSVTRDRLRKTLLKLLDLVEMVDLLSPLLFRTMLGGRMVILSIAGLVVFDFLVLLLLLPLLVVLLVRGGRIVRQASLGAGPTMVETIHSAVILLEREES